MNFSGPTDRWRQGVRSIPLLLVLGCALLPPATTAWPYVDCSGPNPTFGLTTLNAHFDPVGKTIDLALQGNFSNLYQYPAAETSQWRASIVTTIMGTQLHRSEGPACSMITGGCPTAPGPDSISTSFSIDQNAPFVELLVSMQIVSAANQTIVCVAVLLEQTMATVNTAISYLPLALALYSGFISFLSIIMRAAVGNGLMSAVATYGLASTSKVIGVHTPGLFDIVFYTQFMVMTGQLSINYPSFYLTFTSLFHWSFLEFRNSFAGSGPANSTSVLTYGGAGSVSQIKAQYSVSNTNLAVRVVPVVWDAEFSTASSPTRIAPAATEASLSMPTAIANNAFQKRQLAVTPNQASPTLASISSPSSALPSSPISASSPLTESPSSSISTNTTTKSKTKTTTTTVVTTATIPLPTATATSTTQPSSTIPTITNPFNSNNQDFQQHNISQFGMEAYAAAIGAFPSDLFLCTLINVILAGGVSLILSAILLVIAWYIAKESHQKGKTLQHVFNFIIGNLLRIWAIFYAPLALSAMYQLTIPEGTLMLAIASASLIIFSVGAIVLLTWRILRASTRLLLFEDLGTLLKYGPLYNTLSEEGTLFFLVNLLVRFLWGLSVAMLPSYGIAQIAVLLAVEFGYMLVIGFRWPFADSGDNKFHLLLGFTRIVITGCSVAYIRSLNTSPEVRELFGYIQMALHLAVFIVMFALILWNTIQVILFWKSRHTTAWPGPGKNYSFEDTVEAEHGWVLTGRPLSRRPEPVMVGPVKSRRYTIEPYLSVTDLQSVSEDGLTSHPTLYRHSQQPTSYHRSRFPSNDSHNPALDMQPDAIIPLSSSPGPMSARSISPNSPSVDSMDEAAIPLQPTQLSPVRSQLPKESYAKFQRMTHQQETPDLRNRRMSEIFKDGRYLYDPSETVGSSLVVAQSEEKQSVWKSMKEPLGGLFSFGKRSIRKAGGDGSKPKAFEVIRPSRNPPIGMNPADDFSHIGDDNLRELNSIGISRFFQESGRNNDQKRSLFVANPEAMASQTTSLRSSMSGIPLAPPHLSRTISAATATSMNTIGHRHRVEHNLSADLTSMFSGIGPATSEQGYPDSRRVSTLSGVQQQQTYPRNSVESNIAEALRSEVPLKLQGGGVLKVSKGPEKAVQYWRKESGQYVGSSADPLLERRQTPLPLATPPLLLLPTTRGPLIDVTLIDTSAKATPSVRSHAGSRAESPTESHNSSNVAASAGRMHEILDRMFSDQDDDSDIASEGEESCSTFSGRVSATIMALHQKRELEEFADAQSLYRSDTVGSVSEHLGPDADDKSNSSGVGDARSGINRAASSSGHPRAATLMSTFSGSVKPVPVPSSTALLRPSKSGPLSRPLAQTPLHPPSILTFSESTTSLYLPGTLSRRSSRTSLRDPGGSSRLASSEISAQSPTTSLATQDSIPTSEATLFLNDSSPGRLEILDLLGEEPATVSEHRPGLINDPKS